MGPVHPSINHIQNRKYIESDLALGIGLPREFSGMHQGSYKLKMGITAWETNKVPYGPYYGYKKILEDLDLLLLPSEWQQRLFEHVNTKSELVPWPIDNWIQFQKEACNRKIFTILCEGKLTHKSNVGYVLAAFLELSKGLEDRLFLILKTESGTLGHLNLPYANVKIIDQVYTSSQYKKLLESCDAFIYPTMADEPPINLLSALGTGLMCAIPNHSGYKEIYPDIRMSLISEKMIPATRYSRKLGVVGDWHDISYTEIAHVMKNMWELHDMWPEFNKKVSSEIISKHNPKAIVNDIIKVIGKYNG